MSLFKRVKSIHNKDIFHRVNYLYQASLLMADKNRTVSCYYGNLFKQVQKKTVLKVDATIKRYFCKRCSLALTPATCEISSSSEFFISTKCCKCKFEKTIPVNHYYQSWNENDASHREVVELSID